ncbi:hypothetical protein NOR_00519 [Metarhizium rileyi]|uniref:Uncharacterized protein n=1 Tax=Metarhizium rileyi (strain RCEF 4871) TaxID=1649241 RepID=A0A167KMM3_METRR|nr:hypothetical protein NOR_00519 [Metarhizium rileyi RCEF 4871]
MPWCDAPRVDFDEEPQYRWPSWRVGHKLEDLFGELHEQFNTIPIFIQDPDAFHHDVAELAGDTQSKTEFLRRLQERRNQRLEELRDFEKSLAALMATGFGRLTDDQMKSYFVLCRTASFDSLISFCASFLGPNQYGTEPSLDQFKRSPIPTPRIRHSSPDTTVSSIVGTTRRLDQNVVKCENEALSGPTTGAANRKRKRMHDNEIPRKRGRRFGSSLRHAVGEDGPQTPSPEVNTKTVQQTPRWPRHKISRAQSKPQTAPTSQHARSERIITKIRRAAKPSKGSTHSHGEKKFVTRNSRRLAGKPPETGPSNDKEAKEL